MQFHKALLAFLLVGCRATPPSAPVSAVGSSSEPVTSRDLSGPWSAAIAAKDASAIETMLALPFTLYYDDGYSDPFHPAECVPVRVVREITTDAERRRVAACIAATVTVTSVSSPADPIGIAPADRVLNVAPPEVHADVKARSADHGFTRVPATISGDYDVTLAVRQQGAVKADLVVLWTIHG